MKEVSVVTLDDFLVTELDEPDDDAVCEVLVHILLLGGPVQSSELFFELSAEFWLDGGKEVFCELPVEFWLDCGKEVFCELDSDEVVNKGKILK